MVAAYPIPEALRRAPLLGGSQELFVAETVYGAPSGSLRGIHLQSPEQRQVRVSRGHEAQWNGYAQLKRGQKPRRFMGSNVPHEGLSQGQLYDDRETSSLDLLACGYLQDVASHYVSFGEGMAAHSSNHRVKYYGDPSW